jgi:hypothetical protein
MILGRGGIIPTEHQSAAFVIQRQWVFCFLLQNIVEMNFGIEILSLGLYSANAKSLVRLKANFMKIIQIYDPGLSP